MSTEKIEILQRFVNGFGDDLRAVQAAINGAPEPAQRLLIGGLNYALDMLDMFPDSSKGIGIADDAIVLRLAAKLAVAAGATDAALGKLAAQAGEVETVFGDLVPRLEKLVAQMPDREVRGRTAAKIISHKDTRVMFDADIGREAKRHVAEVIDTKVEGPERAVIDLKKMIEAALTKAKL